MLHNFPFIQDQFVRLFLSLQLTVVHLVTHNVDLETTLTQQKVQRYPTAVTQVWCQRGGWELCVLGMGGVQTLLIWTALKVRSCSTYSCYHFCLRYYQHINSDWRLLRHLTNVLVLLYSKRSSILKNCRIGGLKFDNHHSLLPAI